MNQLDQATEQKIAIVSWLPLMIDKLSGVGFDEPCPRSDYAQLVIIQTSIIRAIKLFQQCETLIEGRWNSSHDTLFFSFFSPKLR